MEHVKVVWEYCCRLKVIEELYLIWRVLNSVPTLDELHDIHKDLLFIHDCKCWCGSCFNYTCALPQPPPSGSCIEHITQIVAKCRHHSLMCQHQVQQKGFCQIVNEKKLHTLGCTVDELSRLDQTVEIQQVIQTLKQGLCASDIQTHVHFVKIQVSFRKV